MRARHEFRWALPLLVWAMTACGEVGPEAEISARRVASRPSSPVLLGATPSQRFGAFDMGMGGMGGTEEASDNLIAYDLPNGWQALPTTSERLVNLRPAGVPEASCYLSFFQGSGGGLEANVNRWRSQLGAEPLASDAIAALPKHGILGREATVVEAEGSFAGMSGGSPLPGFKLLGLAVCEPNGSLFLKFIAPAALVDAQREAFFALATSLRLSEQEHGPGDGHDHGEAGGAKAGGGAGGAGGGSGGALAWMTPAGWEAQPPRAMREVTFSLGEGAECYVARLVGDAGGLRANLDRWSDQVGRGPLSNEAYAALPKVTMLGQSVPWLEIEGDFTGMDGATRAGQGLLGVACIRASDSLFVKLTGPESVVRAQRENFLAFVESLEEKP
jgi:hypothetical protein